MSFLDKDHAYIKRRADSVFGPNDTGLKLTMMYVIGVEGDRTGPTFKLYQGTEESTIETISLKGNTMVLFNSRAFEYELSESTSKTIIMTNQVPGPA